MPSAPRAPNLATPTVTGRGSTPETPVSPPRTRRLLPAAQAHLRLLARDTAVLAVGAVALAARVVYLAGFTAHQRLNSDASQYNTLAANLAHGHGFADVYPQLAIHPTAFRPPLYPCLLALFYRVFGASVGLGRGLNVALGVVGAFLVVAVVRRHVSTRAGVAAGLAVAISPNLVANATTTLSEPLGTILLVLLLDAVARRRWTLGGALLGLLLLTRPSAQALAVLLVIWVVVACRHRWRKILAFVLPVVVLLAPWIIRNWVQLGSPVYTTSNGYNLAAIYGPPAQRTGEFNDPLFDPYYRFMRLDQFDEVRWSRHLQRIGLDALQHHPGYVLHVLRHNGAAYFELRPRRNLPAEVLDGRSLRVRADTLWLFYLSLVLGIAGLVLALLRHRPGRPPTDPRRKATGSGRWFVWLVVVEAVAFTAASVLLVSAPRLRAPVDVALAIGVGYLVDALWPRPSPELVAETPL